MSRARRPRHPTVGYGHPPEAHRFTPGQSGNPRGRPKGTTSKKLTPPLDPLAKIVLDEAARLIPVRDGDRTVTVSMQQAIIRSLCRRRGQGRAAGPAALLPRCAGPQRGRRERRRHARRSRSSSRSSFGRSSSTPRIPRLVMTPRRTREAPATHAGGAAMLGSPQRATRVHGRTATTPARRSAAMPRRPGRRGGCRVRLVRRHLR